MLLSSVRWGRLQYLSSLCVAMLVPTPVSPPTCAQWCPWSVATTPCVSLRGGPHRLPCSVPCGVRFLVGRACNIYMYRLSSLRISHVSFPTFFSWSRLRMLAACLPRLGHGTSWLARSSVSGVSTPRSMMLASSCTIPALFRWTCPCSAFVLCMHGSSPCRIPL
jgi:hypothetical protein